MTLGDFAADFADWATRPVLTTAPGAREAARFSLLDTLACIQAGVGQPQPRAALESLAAVGDSGPVMPTGGGPNHTLTGAALVTGARAHALDFDDYELAGSSHPSSPIFSALLSLAGPHGLTVAEVEVAWLVGYEAIVTLGSALGHGHYDKGWHSTLTLGPIGVAAACARALRLSDVATANAMALATSSAGGSLRQAGFDAKALHVGLAAQAGLQAALLARAGATANTAVWEQTGGFFDLYGTVGSPGFAGVTGGWGDGTAHFPVIRKRWPACAYTQRAIAAGSAFAGQLGTHLGDQDAIESLTYRMPGAFHQVAHYGVPKNDAQARFSVPYCLAAALIGGAITPYDFDRDRYDDPARRALTARVELDLYDLPPGHSGAIDATSPERLIVSLSNGDLQTVNVAVVPGGAEQPMSEEQLVDKAAESGLDRAMAHRLLAAAPDETLSRALTG